MISCLVCFFLFPQSYVWSYNTHNLSGNFLLLLCFFFLSLVWFEFFFFLSIVCLILNHIDIIKKKKSTNFLLFSLKRFYFFIFLPGEQTRQQQLQWGAKQTSDIVWVNRGRMNSQPTNQPSASEWRLSSSAAAFVECLSTFFQKHYFSPLLDTTHTPTHHMVQRTNKQTSNLCGGLSGSSAV